MGGNTSKALYSYVGNSESRVCTATLETRGATVQLRTRSTSNCCHLLSVDGDAGRSFTAIRQRTNTLNEKYKNLDGPWCSYIYARQTFMFFFF